MAGLGDDRFQEWVPDPLAQGNERRIVAEMVEKVILNLGEIGRVDELVLQRRQETEVHDITPHRLTAEPARAPPTLK